MKKTNQSNRIIKHKLTFKYETIKTLARHELRSVAGGFVTGEPTCSSSGDPICDPQ